MHVETECQKVLYSKHFVTSQKCPYHVTFDLDLDLEHTLDAGPWGTIVCKFGGDRVMFVVEEAICAKFTDRQTDGRRTPRDCISSWNELIKNRVNVPQGTSKWNDNFHLKRSKVNVIGRQKSQKITAYLAHVWPTYGRRIKRRRLRRRLQTRPNHC